LKLNSLRRDFFCLQSEMVLGGDNPEHREPFESFVKEYLRTGKDIIVTIISVGGDIYPFPFILFNLSFNMSEKRIPRNL